MLTVRLRRLAAAAVVVLVPVAGAPAAHGDARADAVPTVAAKVPVAEGPTAIAVSADGTRVYVVSEGATGAPDNVLSALDATTLSVVAESATCPAPVDVAATPVSVIVACGGDGTLRVLNPATLSQTMSIPLGADPAALAIPPDGREAYVLAYGSQAPKTVPTLIIVNLTTSAVVARVRVGVIPRSLALSPSGKRAYVSNWGGQSISVVNTQSRRLVTTIDVGRTMPGAMAVNPDGTRLLVNRENAGVRKPRILTVNTERLDVVSAFRPGFSVDSMQYNAVRLNVAGGFQQPGTLLLVAGEVNNEESFVIIDLLSQRVVSSLPLAPTCSGVTGNQDMAVAPDGGRAFMLGYCLGHEGWVTAVDIPT